MPVFSSPYLAPVPAAPRLAWSPYNLGRPALSSAGWWCADDHANSALITDDGGGLISSWKDRLNQLALTGATTFRPTWGATSWNGVKQGIVGNAASRLQAVSTGVLPVGAVAGEVWMAVQLAQNNPIPTSAPMGYGATSGATARTCSFSSSGGVPRYIVTDGATSLLDLNASFAAQSYGIIGAYWSGTTEGGRVNGIDTSPLTQTIATLNTGTALVRLFTAVGGGAGWAGAVRHYLILPLLTPALRLIMEGWLVWDCFPNGNNPLPPSHPYKFAAP
jgi:hypothetical protein